MRRHTSQDPKNRESYIQSGYISFPVAHYHIQDETPVNGLIIIIFHLHAAINWSKLHSQNGCVMEAMLINHCLWAYSPSLVFNTVAVAKMRSLSIMQRNNCVTYPWFRIRYVNLPEPLGKCRVWNIQARYR